MTGADRTLALPHAILAAASARPGLSIMFCNATHSESVSLAELVDRAARGATAIRGLGVQPGDSVAVQVPSRFEGVVAQAAAVLAGAVLVPVVPSYGPRELGFILRESRARLLVTPDRWGRRDYLVDLHRLGDCPDLLSVAVIADSVPRGYPDWTQLTNDSDPFCATTTSAADDVCLLDYTSGTTGQPKGVQHTHATLLAELRTRLTGAADASLVLAAFPSGHIAGTLGLLRMLQGMPHVVMDTWDAATGLINEHRVTATGGTPFFLTTLLDLAGEVDVSSLREYGVGGASVPPSVIERAHRRGGTTVHKILREPHVHKSVHKRHETAPGEFSGGRFAW